MWPDPCRNLSLRALLRWGFGALIASSVLIAALSLLVWNWAFVAFDEFKNEDAPLAALTSHSMDAWLRVRRYEKDFFLTAQSGIGVSEAHARYVTLVNTHLSDIRADFRQIRKVGGTRDTELTAHLSELEHVLNTYEKGFEVVVDLTMRLGYYDAGLEAAMRAQAHEAERLVRAVPRWAPLLPRLLSLRRDEKDFILRSKTQYVTAFSEEAARLETEVDRLAGADQPALLRALSRYVALFNTYVAATRELEERKRTYMEASQTLEPMLDRLQEATSENATATLGSVEQRITGAMQAAAAVSLAAIVVALLVATFVLRRIHRGTRRILRFAEDVAGGQISARLSVRDRGEFGALETALNRMADRLQRDAESVHRYTVVLEKSNRRIAWLGEMTSMLQTAANIDEAADIVTRHLRQMPIGRAGGVYLYKDSRNYLDALARWGTVALPDSFVPDKCWALRRGQPCGPTDASTALACTHLAPDATGTPYLCLPLTAQGGLLGLMHVSFATTDPTEIAAEADFARGVSEQLALTLANLRLRETLREQSLRDPLTNLFNRRYLEVSLERELAHAKRESQPLAVLMLDVDYFKRFNDAHGHDGGDAALRHLGRTLQESCRASDLACRYGGEEFTVVLPGMDADGAEQWAKMLLAKVRKIEIGLHGTVLSAITTSIGIAVYPEQGGDAETLLQAADAALYEAKRGGRDRYVISGQRMARASDRPVESDEAIPS